MKKNYPAIVISLFITLLVFGDNERVIAADTEHRHEHSEHASKDMANKLILNNGDRWEMDNHTRMMSSKMEKTFFSTDHSNQASLNALGSKLETQLGELISGCTMDGEAHNQLHIFLSDYGPAVKNLANAKDYEAARSLAIKIKGKLEVYKTHFK